MDNPFTEEEGVFEGKLDDIYRERAGQLAYRLAPDRIRIEPALRQMLGYMLLEPLWSPDPIDLMVIKHINGTDVVWARLRHAPPPRDAFQTFLHGPVPPAHYNVYPYARLPQLLQEIRAVGERAELDTEDIEWLLELPRVKDMRPEFPDAQT
jgi:hypothetical protein